jgi:hypothetical protein
MRLSQDSSSWKSSGIVRRDFRATHGEPEEPKAPKRHKSQTQTQCPEGGVHEVVRYVTRSHQYISTDAEGAKWRVSYDSFGVRCAKCLSTKISPVLCVAYADLLSHDKLASILEHHWCRDGHLWDDVVIEEYVRSGRYRWGYRPVARRVCVMCAKFSHGGQFIDAELTAKLLTGASIPDEVAWRIIHQRPANRQEVRTPFVETGRAARRAARAEELDAAVTPADSAGNAGKL